jgi:carbonic anhydrase
MTCCSTWTRRRADVTSTDDLLANNEAHAAQFAGPLPAPPAKRVAVLACMDARLDLFAILGLVNGDAHIIRNAGGVVSDDAIRSLAISQRLLGTEEIVLVHHTDCGLLRISDEQFSQAIREDVGLEPPWTAEAFADLDEHLRESIARVKSSPFLPRRGSVRGFVFDVTNGQLTEVR